jgi:hypothetical protein
MMHVAGDVKVAYLAVGFEPFPGIHNIPLAAFHRHQA